ncbi:hypothetical protein YYC_00099 [Plasmodium yoelii 17X]|uniref:Uncharacterized protein n=4 Tax=Plasmodium yoelii TaxID=5861 RepID=A0AAE9WKZ7_PLAYO|nr:conserved Plasmodium protein, unknown function [Plasmodium yoelii]EAA21534.1 hypothetical protein [Plasmodium yoelii yoelii]ETB63264.1 hypothetical protein YYC_00099 [Plasmodium yoelii 17X]WBY54440.1 hypothetical protein Py17XNL_000104691 [Plasmodium yoelii yoelii]CDU15860.1 conserved Plasmodium protein, unknown function [Plasmodium yoelii]VTZ71455.1 conserved Plasmodium protein, unknown function [Plasmodium yoelii]|eukprot:XP_729969.1 conserved Plasmodium protein, unknown function [Plasmodium yoelii]
MKKKNEYINYSSPVKGDVKYCKKTSKSEIINRRHKIDKDGYFESFNLCIDNKKRECNPCMIPNSFIYNKASIIGSGRNEKNYITSWKSKVKNVVSPDFIYDNGDSLNSSNEVLKIYPEGFDLEENLVINKCEESIINNDKINSKLVDIIILKNILNIYFLFDKGNEGYINQEYACYVIKMIYENDKNFMIKNVTLNGNEINKKMNKVFRKEFEKNEVFFCTKQFANFLLAILLKVSIFQKKDNIIRKPFFINIIKEFVDTCNQNDSNDLFGVFKYPRNIIRKFYDYVYYLKTINDEETMKKSRIKKKNKQLENICFLDGNLVNASLDTHINYFKEQTKKKLKKIKIDIDKKEMTECTFSPSTNKKPLYLLKQKFQENIDNIFKTKESINKIYAPINTKYDIDNSIERTMLLPDNSFLKDLDSSTDNEKNKYNINIENNDTPLVQIKYIIHQGYKSPNNISWYDTLRNT